jgi:hypothetical protein
LQDKQNLLLNESPTKLQEVEVLSKIAVAPKAMTDSVIAVWNV